MLDSILHKTKIAQKRLALLSADDRNKCLENIAIELKNNEDKIIQANMIDINKAKESGLSSSLIERLTLNHKRIDDLANSIYSLIKLEDLVGKVDDEIVRPNGLLIKKIIVPFGVIAVIFESRPNVCVDIATLCLKTGNACVLKGGKEAINTNIALVDIMKNAVKEYLISDCITLITDTSRETTNDLITKRDYIDLLIPRGGKGLIQYVISNTKIPYIETGAGNCHLYINEKCDYDMAIKIAINAKCQRPSVCNAIENIIIDKNIADSFLPILYDEFSKLKVEMRGCDKTIKIIPCLLASNEDYYTEYNDYIVSIKIVDDINEAIAHINEHSSKHSETIVTNDEKNAIKFLNEIDSACVYHNASTRFTDGGEFGFGAEIGISTQKLHARGPMGLREICSYKYIILGNGQVR